MLQSAEDAPRVLAEGRSLLGPGWKVVDSFDDLEDPDEFSDPEEEMYVTLDLGNAIEQRALQTETQYQLIGLDTPLPFLKIANQTYQGESTPLIGDEVIFGLIRNQGNPHNPTRPPIHTTHHRLTFRPVTLRPIDQSQPKSTGTANEKEKEGQGGKAPEEPRSIFMLRPPTKGPNKMREHLRVDTSISTETLERDLRIAEEEANAEAADEVGRGSSRWNTEQPQAGPSRISSRPDQPDQPAKKRGRGKAPKVQTPEPPEEPPEAPDLEDVAPPPPSAGPSGLTFVTINPHTGKKVGRPKRTPASERTTSGAPEKVVITDGAELDGLDLDKLSANIRIEITAEAQHALGFDPSLTLGNTEFSVREIKRIRAGRPISGPGSRGGRGSRVRVSTRRPPKIFGETGRLVFTIGGEDPDEAMQPEEVGKKDAENAAADEEAGKEDDDLSPDETGEVTKDKT